MLANERTFAGRSKASFASIGLGLGFQALFKRTEPDRIPKSVATLFILLGILMIWLAERRADRLLRKRSGNHVQLMSRRMFRFMAIAVTIGGLALVPSIWLLIEAAGWRDSKGQQVKDHPSWHCRVVRSNTGSSPLLREKSVIARLILHPLTRSRD